MYAENWHQVFERNQVSVPMEGLFIKEKDILKSCYWNFWQFSIIAVVKKWLKFKAVSSHSYSHWGLVVEALKSYSNFPVFYKEVCFFILDSYTKEKEEKSDFVTAQDPHPPPLLNI